MGETETDYLVVGAGASGMAFVDALVADERRRRGAGGPAARAGRPLAGRLSVRAAAPAVGELRRELTDARPRPHRRDRTERRVLRAGDRRGDLRLLPAGPRRDPRPDRQGALPRDDRVPRVPTPRGTGSGRCSRARRRTIRVRRKLVDATYIESSIPSRHVPPFTVDAGVRLIPPNDLVDLDQPAAGFTVLGAGKTAMDTCSWLLDAGVDPDVIEWFRPRDPWLFNRASTQPLDLVGSYMGLQASWVAAAATAADGQEFARRLEDDEIFVRIDPRTEPHLFRGATISVGEVDALRDDRADRPRPQGPPHRDGLDRHRPGRRALRRGPGLRRLHRPGPPCAVTAAGLRARPDHPPVRHDRVRAVERGDGRRRRGPARRRRGPEPPVPAGGLHRRRRRHPRARLHGHDRARGPLERRRGNEWTESSRLNPAKDAAAHLDDPRVPAAFDTIVGSIGEALTNLGRVVGATT